MSERDHHGTPEEIQRCPICQMLIYLRFWAKVEYIKQLLGRKS